MADYIISCCSTADLTAEHLEKKGVSYICFNYFLDGKPYKDDLWQSTTPNEFYSAMVNGASTKTAQVNVDEFVEYFTPFLEAGKDIIHISLSSGISGVYNSANVARRDLLEKYPERKIYVVDSLAASSGYGLFVDALADMKASGMGIDKLNDWANAHKLELHHWFFSQDLTFYVKGGRISKAAGWFGTVLKICPLLNMDGEGHLVPRYKIRGKSRVKEEIVAKMRQHARGKEDYDGKCYICHSNCYEDARKVADLVEASFPHLDGRVEINDVGPTIGSHTGPGTVALFFWGDSRYGQ